MVAPAAHTSKGLAKAFVSSAGGKGPENRDTPAPLIVHAEARGCPLPCASRAAAASKCSFAEKTYAGLCRPVMRHCARRGTSSKVCASVRLAGDFGYKHNADPGARGLLSATKQLLCTPFP